MEYKPGGFIGEGVSLFAAMGDPIFKRRFSGVGRLYGAEHGEGIRRAHVCVVGIGGVGSWSVEALARSGMERLTLIDLDHVAESNINRQVQAREETLGQAKVLAMAARVASINPECRVTTVEDFVTPENVAALVPDCDALIDAIDQVRAKAALIAHCRDRGIPVVTTGGAGGKTEPAMIRVDDLSRTTQDPLAAKLRATLRREYGFSRESGRRFGVDCVYSAEPIRRLAACSEAMAPQGLNCAGYGSSVCITAAFGLCAAARVLNGILVP